MGRIRNKANWCKSMSWSFVPLYSAYMILYAYYVLDGENILINGSYGQIIRSRSFSSFSIYLGSKSFFNVAVFPQLKLNPGTQRPKHLETMFDAVKCNTYMGQMGVWNWGTRETTGYWAAQFQSCTLCIACIPRILGDAVGFQGSSWVLPMPQNISCKECEANLIESFTGPAT